MKLYHYILLATAALMSSCSGGAGSLFGGGYDSAECERLSIAIERHDSLTQNDYSEMINQSEQILRYLVEKNDAIGDLPEDCRLDELRQLRASPEYMERFGYFFTLGSALYQADTHGLLDESNRRHYADLDEYNTRFSRLADRMN